MNYRENIKYYLYLIKFSMKLGYATLSNIQGKPVRPYTNCILIF